jgi:hypothetical protein
MLLGRYRRCGTYQRVPRRDELAKRKLEPDELRQLVEAERASILDELSALAKEDAAAREKEAKRQARYNR